MRRKVTRTDKNKKINKMKTTELTKFIAYLEKSNQYDSHVYKEAIKQLKSM